MKFKEFSFGVLIPVFILDTRVLLFNVSIFIVFHSEEYSCYFKGINKETINTNNS